MRGLYAKFTGSVDSRLNALAEAKTFCNRAKANGWTDAQLLADVYGEGRRKYGKTKLSIDESRKFLAACLQLAASDESVIDLNGHARRHGQPCSGAWRARRTREGLGNRRT